MKKKCELCSHTARIYCESDQANLCYDCDHSIHSANFLVAKHFRSLLCRRCLSPTPWIASGLDLGRAASLCPNCLREDSSRRRLQEGETSHRENDAVEGNFVVRDHPDEDMEEDGGYSEEEEDGENQVVPWTSLASPPPPTTASSSTSQESSSSDCFSSPIERKRVDPNFDSEDYTVSSSEGFTLR